MTKSENLEITIFAIKMKLQNDKIVILHKYDIIVLENRPFNYFFLENIKIVTMQIWENT